MTMRRIFIFGATSAIAEATARRFAVAGSSFFLVARDRNKLEALADDLRVRGAADVATAVADALDFDHHQALVNAAFEALSGLDTALIAHGTLPDQKSCEQSFETVRRAFEINALGVMSLLTHVANRFEAQGFGTIAVLGSVAGDRGRQSNYVYGAAKGAVSVFMQGLRNRLHRRGVHVLTIKPGWVDTPMTAAFRKGILWACPQKIAAGIYNAIENSKNVVYLPWFWSPIMRVIRTLPESIFNRLRL
jgi:decaprenylphospho-beta-D-erythro-pentofuranosid-2-ulose 2-reductase